MIRYLFDTEGLMTPIDNVHQHPANDNNGDTDEIIASMRTTGVYRPVYASKQTGNIVAGNHTYLALLEMGAEFVPVQWVDCPEEYIELRILAADNKIARNARPDPALTKMLLSRIVEATPTPTSDPAAALLGTGFRPEEYERLLKPPQPLSLSGIGRETLEHRITCPECGHTWSRSGGHDDEEDD